MTPTHRALLSRMRALLLATAALSLACDAEPGAAAEPRVAVARRAAVAPSGAPANGAAPSGGATGTAPSESSARGAGNSGGAAGITRIAVPSRLVAIGDLHGDFAATRAAFRLAGAIDEADRWIGGDLTLVQTGDQLDRGDDERAILDLLRRLTIEARASGGRLVVLNGNHETMNVQGDFRYVTPAGFQAFAGVSPRSPLARSAPPLYESRAAAFLPGGAYALELADRDVIAVVGDSVFAHGGVLPEHAAHGIDRINREVQQWMRSGRGRVPESVASERSPVWVRDYSMDPVPAETCQKLGKVLAALGVARMVVGHTVQPRGISSACDERVYRIDVGLARYYGSNPVQVLEIQGPSVRTLTAPRSEPR